MVKTKGIEASMKNWNASHARVANNYKEGVQRADDPIGKGVAAEALYVAKLSESMAEGRRATNLAKVTNEQWKAAAGTKGAKRIVDGMKAAEPKMRTGLGRVLNAIEEVQLPPRSADGMENLVNRGGAIVQRLMALKKE